MLQMRVKTKIITAVIGIIAITMLVSSLIVSFIIYGQNEETSNQILQQSATILRDDISALSTTLVSNTHQATVANDIGETISFAATVSYEEGESMGMVSSYQSLVKGLYNICLTGHIWKAAIYNQKNRLFGFAKLESDQSTVGFPRTNDFLSAMPKKGEKINADHWKPMSDFSGFPLTFKGKTPQKEKLEFRLVDESIALTATAPIFANTVDEKTGGDKKVQVGFVVAFYRINSDFTKRLSKITGSKIGIIKQDQKTIGDLNGYPELKTDLFDPNPPDWDIQNQAVTLNTIDIEGAGYFQGLLPIYSEKGIIATLAILRSISVARNNTFQVVKVLALVSLGCIIVFFPLAFLFSNSFSKPLEELSSVLSNVEVNGDFSPRVTVRSMDEVGKTSQAFNNLMDALQDSIGNVNNVMAAVAKGDLSHQITGDYQGELNRLQTNTNDSITMLGQMMSQVIEASQQVNTGAQELSRSSQSLANGTTQQASTLEEIASSMDEIENRTRANRDNATQAKNVTHQTIETVEDGNRQMESMLKAMESINQSSAQVANVIKTIDEIAFQTNLLALNAAVEAARAGKYGKGFAVVAEEVRNLASRSAEAAKNTTDLIENAIKEVNKGVQNADTTASILSKITEGINQSNTLINEISDASVEQANSVGEINDGLANVNNVVQQNSSISEQSAAASDELSAQASRLQEMVNLFILTDQLMNGNSVPLLEEEQSYTY